MRLGLPDLTAPEGPGRQARACRCARLFDRVPARGILFGSIGGDAAPYGRLSGLLG